MLECSGSEGIRYTGSPEEGRVGEKEIGRVIHVGCSCARERTKVVWLCGGYKRERSIWA